MGFFGELLRSLNTKGLYQKPGLGVNKHRNKLKYRKELNSTLSASLNSENEHNIDFFTYQREELETKKAIEESILRQQREKYVWKSGESDAGGMQELAPLIPKDIE